MIAVYIALGFVAGAILSFGYVVNGLLRLFSNGQTGIFTALRRK